MHEAPAIAGSGEGLDPFRGLPQVERLFLRLEPVTTRSHCGNLTIAPRPKLAHW